MKSPPGIVHAMFAADKGRERFWAEKSAEKDSRIELRFIDGLILKSKILANEPPRKFVSNISEEVGSLLTFLAMDLVALM